MFAPAFKLSGPPWRAQVFVGVPGGAAGTVGQLKSQGGGKANLRNPLQLDTMEGLGFRGPGRFAFEGRGTSVSGGETSENTVTTRKTIQAESPLFLPRFLFPRFII